MLTDVYLLKKYRPLLTLEEVAAELHYAPGTLENKIRAGTAEVRPAADRVKPLLFHYADVARAIDAKANALDA